MDARFRTVKMKKAKDLLCLLWLLIMVDFSDASRSGLASQTDLEVKKILSRLNKTPLKSIKSPDGDIIDCVLVSHQPALDHPLLKNHKIQMSPSCHPEGLVFDDSKVSRAKTRGEGGKKPIIQPWHLNGRCPEGTVPIRRIKEEDVLRASSVESFGKKKHGSIPKPKSADIVQNSGRPGHEYAAAYVVGDKYYGTRATINVWAPTVQQPDEFSLSQLWVSGGSASDLNTIEAGWQVYPMLYGDNNTRFFIYWTSDNYQSTGCYNLKCSGFIQINNNMALGATISPLSAYDGSQIDITIIVWKDPKVGNWWLQYGKYILGYWPANMFSHLIDSASTITWGGEVVNTRSDGMHTTTQMGSGHFPEEGFGKASFFKNIQTVDVSNQFRNVDVRGTDVDNSNCYNIAFGKSDDGGNYFYYGGPGRNPNCP